MTYGGIVLSLKMPDKNGSSATSCSATTSWTDYIKNSPPYFGALVGRYGNRIGKAQFTLDGQTTPGHQQRAQHPARRQRRASTKWLDSRQGRNGPRRARLILNYTSKDGEEGFPGNLKVTATYTLTDNNGLRLDFTATTDKDTVCNLTHHSYFNLAGKGDILGHLVNINADNFTPVDAR